MYKNRNFHHSLFSHKTNSKQPFQRNKIELQTDRTSTNQTMLFTMGVRKIAANIV